MGRHQTWPSGASNTREERLTTAKTLPVVQDGATRAPCLDRAGQLPNGCPGWCEFAQPDAKVISYDGPETPEELGPGVWLPGPIQLTDRVGEGGMGVVFRGWHDGLQQEVAVKVLASKWVHNPVARGRFLSEARAMSRVDSPHVVRLHHLDLHAGVPYMVMDFVRGTTLSERLDAGTLSYAQGFAVLHAVAQAVGAIHSASIVHNDIKSANIMLGSDGRVTLLDFGLARPIANACRTNPDELSGTPAYMAPELAGAWTDRPHAASDVYSLGVLAFEVFSGQVPFDHDDPYKILDMHIECEAPRLSDWAPNLPHGLDDLVAGCLHKDAHQRVPSAHAFARRLAALRPSRSEAATSTGSRSAGR